MPKFTVKLMQFVEEICEIEVEAISADVAEMVVLDSIERNMLDEEYDLDWEDGTGIHYDGVTIDDVKGAS
jgi:hypothetical protein